MHGDHQDGRVRRADCYLPRGFQSVHHGHLKIEYDNVEFLATELRDSFLAVRGLIAHFPVVLSLQHCPQAAPHQIAVIYYQDPSFLLWRFNGLRHHPLMPFLAVGLWIS